MSVVLRLHHGGGRVSLPLKRRAHVRDRIAAEIERLVGMLDAIDGDTDAEPSLGWPDGELRQIGGVSATDDREDDAGDDREPDEDCEPILGWSEGEDQGYESAGRFGETWVHDEDERRA
ncbi:hypothetical protein [Antarcticirhabdus aurantiaca]|uniref:Uncharacterized protein n=1 Tax=Antarcticirhabdus aurantiaca TaxID=2606717 RepID=A0ACD4NKT6_9HYPH|nr:hypothetical protein [Antarcticirhabdus aurantiaca]WAJ27404.1 hypothetical protein OXU80_21540 [Jeongeuplla avenae]